MDVVYLLQQWTTHLSVVGAFTSADAAVAYADANHLDETSVVPVPWFDDYGMTGPPIVDRPTAD